MKASECVVGKWYTDKKHELTLLCDGVFSPTHILFRIDGDRDMQSMEAFSNDAEMEEIPKPSWAAH